MSLLTLALKAGLLPNRKAWDKKKAPEGLVGPCVRQLRSARGGLCGGGGGGAGGGGGGGAITGAGAGTGTGAGATMGGGGGV